MLNHARRSSCALETAMANCGDHQQCWVIVRLLPKMQRVTVNRFHRRVDADDHLQFLQQQVPAGQFEVMFDINPEEAQFSYGL
jgi:hypothetical protein